MFGKGNVPWLDSDEESSFSDSSDDSMIEKRDKTPAYEKVIADWK